MTAEIIEISEQRQESTEIKSNLNNSMNNVIKLFQSRKMGALWITLIVSACSIWTLWNITHFKSSLEYKNELIKQELVLQKEIDEINKRIEIASFNNSEAHKSHAESRVFENYTSIAEWLYELTIQAQRLGFKVEYKMQQPNTHSDLNEINIVPIEIEVFAWNKTNIEAVYQQYLVFLKDFLNQHWFIKLEKTSMENISGDSAKLALSIHVYMWDKNNIEASIY